MLRREQPIADGLDDAAAMLGDPGIGQFAVQHLQPFERSPLIGLHQPAVADCVGREDRGEAAIPVQ
jgi:hypothetical protein